MSELLIFIATIVGIIGATTGEWGIALGLFICVTVIPIIIAVLEDLE